MNYQLPSSDDHIAHLDLCLQSQVSATQVDIHDYAPTAPAEVGPQAWARLLSLSAGVPHIELLPNERSEDGMLNKYVFGRSRKKSDFVFDDQRISSVHCCIYEKSITVSGTASTKVCIADSSANGTFINGKKIGREHKQVLHDGDELSLIQPDFRSVDDWQKARFIVKIPVNDSAFGMGNVMLGENMFSFGSADSAVIRRRLSTISHLLEKERDIHDYYQMIRPVGEGAHGQVICVHV